MNKALLYRNIKPDMKYIVLDFFNKELRSCLSFKARNHNLFNLVKKYNYSLSLSNEISLDVILVGLKKKKEENINKISKTLRETKNLRVFKAILEHNGLTDSELYTLFSPFQGFSSLVQLELNLETNQISKAGLKTIVDTFNCIPKLEYLDIKLKNNSFDTIDDFAKGLGKLKEIKVLKLNIYNKKLKTNFVKSLTDSIFQLTSLEILKLDLQYSENANLNTLNKMLDKLINLKEFELILSNTFLGEKALHTLNDSLAASKIFFHKFYLDLRNNRINTKSIKLMNNSWKNLKNITSFTFLLSSNFINDQSMEYLSKCIFTLNNLNFLNLDLEKNDINEYGGKVFFSGLHNLGKIKKLVLNFNENRLGNSVFSLDLLNLSTLYDIQMNLDRNSIDKDASDYLHNLFTLHTDKLRFYISMEKNESTITKLTN